VRAWRIEQEGGGLLSGWVDEQGRMVESEQFGLLTLHRMAFEMAYQNWIGDTARRARVPATDEDVVEATAIEARATFGDWRALERVRVRLRGTDVGRWALAGGRQRLAGDTLVVTREVGASLTPSFTLPLRDERFAKELSPEPLVQSDAPEIRLAATRIAGGERDPRVVAERLSQWVHDSLAKRITMSIPNARQVLRTRRGDCNEHTQLYVALARSLGLPARSVGGLASVRGKFYYHVWPEVWLGDWVAVDPTFGQFPADAAHLRFVIGGYDRQADLLRLIGSLDIDVLSTQ
jgi:transglutaminase-like putative cysteine protease